MRLDKYLVASGIGTRKEVVQYIVSGKVTLNGKIEKELWPFVEEGKDIVVFGGEIARLVEKRYYMFHKPAGCITARKDKEMKTVLDYFPKQLQKGLFPVGRLDKDTEGLLFLTNDGDFDHQLMHPKHHMIKNYFFWVYGELTQENIQKLMDGISIGENEPQALAKEIQIAWQGPYKEREELLLQIQSKQIKKKSDDIIVTSGYITIAEGRKHQVKRMLKAVGCYVVYLKRVSIGPVVLDDKLAKGSFRELYQEEIEKLRKS